MSACCIPLQSSRKAFFDSLLARKKSRLQALIAVARKLLHALHGIFRSGLKYEGQSCFQGSRCPDPISFRDALFGTDPHLTDLQAQSGVDECIGLLA